PRRPPSSTAGWHRSRLTPGTRATMTDAARTLRATTDPGLPTPTTRRTDDEQQEHALLLLRRADCGAGRADLRACGRAARLRPRLPEGPAPAEPAAARLEGSALMAQPETRTVVERAREE